MRGAVIASASVRRRGGPLGCALLACGLVACGLSGCGARTELEVPAFDAGPPGMDAAPDAARDAGDGGLDASDECRDLRTELIEPKVDVLFVVDSSGSMVEEQEALIAAFRTLAAGLATGDIDEDGVPDFPAATDLHVAVVTTDLGAFDAEEDGVSLRPVGCGRGAPRGEDGILRRGCGLGAPYVSFREGDSIDAFEESFACLARVGTEGCGFEMPLEAALKALTPASSAIRFAGDSAGHGDGVNRGFAREDSVLAIIVLTDEDDGSVGNTRFLEATTEEEIALGTSWLHDVRRYLEGFDALREDPEQIVFAAIAGLPPDLVAPDPGTFDAAAALADPRMQRIYDPDDLVHLAPSCEAPGLGRATPPRRLVELAGLMGDRAVVRSICQSDYRSALGVVTERVGDAIRHTWCAD